jgi:hypothetical protein
MHSPEEFQHIRDNQSNGMGGLPLVGDPDSVARDMARLAAPIILRSGSAVLPICRVDDERVGRGRADAPGRDFPILAQISYSRAKARPRHERPAHPPCGRHLIETTARPSNEQRIAPRQPSHPALRRPSSMWA